MRKARRLLAVLVAVVAAAVALAGCAPLTSLLDTTNGLRDAGYQSVSVKPSGDDVNVSVTVAAVPSQPAVDGVARVVWRDFHERFENLNITVHGEGQTLHQSLSFDQVQARFGARNPAWNRSTLSSATRQVGFEVLLGLLGVGVVVAVVVMLIVRARRRRRPQWPPWAYPGGGYPGSYPGYPASGYPGGGYPGAGYPPGPGPAPGPPAPTPGSVPHYPPPSQPPSSSEQPPPPPPREPPPPTGTE